MTTDRPGSEDKVTGNTDGLEAGGASLTETHAEAAYPGVAFPLRLDRAGRGHARASGRWGWEGSRIRLCAAMQKGWDGQQARRPVATANLAGYLLFCVVGGMLAPVRAQTGHSGRSRPGGSVHDHDGLCTGVVAAARGGRWRESAAAPATCRHGPDGRVVRPRRAALRRHRRRGIVIALIVWVRWSPGAGGLWQRRLAVCWFLFGAVTLALAVGAGALLRDRPPRWA